MKKREINKSNVFKIISILVLLIIILISFLSIYQDVTESNVLYAKSSSIQKTTGRVTAGLYVVNPNEESKGDNS